MTGPETDHDGDPTVRSGPPPVPGPRRFEVPPRPWLDDLLARLFEDVAARFEDLRDDPARVAWYVQELRTEIAEGHRLYGEHLRVIAQASPSDHVLVGLSDGSAAVVELTGSRAPEQPPLPRCHLVASAAEFEHLLARRP